MSKVNMKRRDEMRPVHQLGMLLLVVWFGGEASAKQWEQSILQRIRRQDTPPRGADTPIGVCPIKNVGEFPWLVRFKFDVDPDDNFFKALYFKYFNNEMGRPSHLANEHTLMVGALISPSRVLTCRQWRDMFEEIIRFHLGLLVGVKIYGYNHEKNCHQSRQVKKAVWHPKSSAAPILGNLGDFGLYGTWAPFEVEGDPFLFRKPYPVSEIEQAISALIAKPEHLLMFLFLIYTGIDGKLLDDEGSSFEFIGLPSCRAMPNFISSVKKGWLKIDPQATNTSFFCGNGIPGSWNMSQPDGIQIEGTGYGWDGNSGSVAFYKGNKNGTLLPLGLYAYWMGASGEPRFFTAFSQMLFDWLEYAKFPEPKVSTRLTSIGDSSSASLWTTLSTKSRSSFDVPDAPKVIPTKSSEGRPSSSIGFWILAVTVLASG